MLRIVQYLDTLVKHRLTAPARLANWEISLGKLFIQLIAPGFGFLVQVYWRLFVLCLGSVPI